MAATHTNYYNLNKPNRQDFVSVVTDINDNMDMIDAAMHGLEESKLDDSDKGIANGIASLDAYGKVPSSQLPSYVDDVVEGYLYNGQFYEESAHTTVITPESDKIYVDIPTSTSYRWGGSLYVKIDDPTEVIDDNAGAGDTDKTYSADKIVKLMYGKAPVIEETINTPASVMTFPDGADNLPMGLTVGIEPVQDLHGQESPWPGGGSKNLFNIYAEYTEMTYTNKYEFTLKPNTKYTLSSNCIQTGATANLYMNGGSSDSNGVKDGTSRTATTDENGYLYVSVRKQSAGADGYDLYSAVKAGTYWIQLEEGQTATAYAPYSNICPITGWTGANVTRTGKNLLNPANMKNGEIVNTAGNIEGNGDHKSCLTFIPVKPLTTYTVSGKNLHSREGGDSGGSHNAYVNVAEYSTDNANSFLRRPVNSTSNDNYYTFTTGETAHYVRFSVGMGASEIQLELGSVASAYELFTGSTVYPITFPSSAGTVYGGTLTVNKDGSGTLVVDRAKVTYTGAESEGWERTNARFAITLDSNMQSNETPLSNYLKMVSPGSGSSMEVWTGRKKSDLTQLFVNPGMDVFTNISSWKTYLSTHNLEVIYKLITPLSPITFTAEQIKTLLGVNNVWADTGDVQSIVYPADTKLYVDQQIADKISASQRLMELIVTANREDEMKATKAYSTGNLLIVNGTLYKATTSIANGANLTVNTNVTETTVAAELAALA